MTLAKQIIAHKKDGILSTKQIAAIVGCTASYVRAAWLRHTQPEKYRFRDYERAYAAAHREKMADYQRAYYVENREKIRGSRRAYYVDNREKRVEYQRAYNAAKKQKNHTALQHVEKGSNPCRSQPSVRSGNF